MKFKMNRDWEEAFADKSSQKYKDLKEEAKAEVNTSLFKY